MGSEADGRDLSSLASGGANAAAGTGREEGNFGTVLSTGSAPSNAEAAAAPSSAREPNSAVPNSVANSEVSSPNVPSTASANNGGLISDTVTRDASNYPQRRGSCSKKLSRSKAKVASQPRPPCNSPSSSSVSL